MIATRSGTIQKFLLGFFVAGLLLVAASWMVTGVRPAVYSLTPFALLFVAWLGLSAPAKGSEDAR